MPRVVYVRHYGCLGTLVVALGWLLIASLVVAAVLVVGGLAVASVVVAGLIGLGQLAFHKRPTVWEGFVGVLNRRPRRNPQPKIQPRMPPDNGDTQARYSDRR